MSAAAPRVTVVVPVFNTGPDIEPCLASLQGQTLAPSELDVIFVDDGSTDATPARLAEVVATHPNMRVIRIPPSGAPGRPRNTGLDAARGKYVLFLDADDALAPTALERMAAWADQHDADVVIAKYASASRPRGQAIFGRNRARMSLRSNPALIDSSLGPTKLFRRELLQDAGIRFPEGWRLMEDQFFVLRTYFRARVISLLADRTYAFFRQRESSEHLSYQPLDPDADIAHLRELLDMVEAETEPGALRDRTIRRLYRAEVLARLADEEFVALDDASRGRLVEAARAFATERVDPSIDAGLNAIARLRSSLLRAGRGDDLLELARRLAAVELQASVREAGWHHGQLRLVLEAHLVNHAAGRPVIVVDGGTGPRLDPALTAGIGGADVAVGDELAAVRGNVAIREPGSAEEWVIPTRLSLAFRDGRESDGTAIRWPVVAGVAHVDPRRVGPGELRLDPGRWTVGIRLNLMGIDQRTGIRVDSQAPALEPAVLGDPPTLVTPVRVDDELRLDVQALAGDDARWRNLDVGARRDGAGQPLVVPLPVASDAGVQPLRLELIVRDGEREEAWPAVAHHRFGRLVLVARPAPAGPGAVTLAARLPGVAAEIQLGRATAEGGGLRLDGAASLRPASEQVRWVATRFVSEGRRRYEQLMEQATPLLRRALEATPRPLRAPILRLTRSLRR